MIDNRLIGRSDTALERGAELEVGCNTADRRESGKLQGQPLSLACLNQRYGPGKQH